MLGKVACCSEQCNATFLCHLIRRFPRAPSLARTLPPPRDPLDHLVFSFVVPVSMVLSRYKVGDAKRVRASVRFATCLAFSVPPISVVLKRERERGGLHRARLNNIWWAVASSPWATCSLTWPKLWILLLAKGECVVVCVVRNPPPRSPVDCLLNHCRVQNKSENRDHLTHLLKVRD